jgi:hypothetical protein
MPVLESAIGMCGHEGIAERVFIGVVGEASHWRAVRPHQHILNILCMQAGVL